ncbi:MAG: hypothetical protein ETSY2_35240, partial [Candidatus Entotheonella gemina]
SGFVNGLELQGSETQAIIQKTYISQKYTFTCAPYRTPKDMASESAVPSKYLRPYAERSWFGRWWLRFSQQTVGRIIRLWCQVRIEGEAHIPLKGGVLLASNHISMLDALLIPYAVMETRGMQIVWSPAKEELFRIPVVGRVLLSWGSFPVRRGRGDLRTMRRIMTLLRDHRMMLFPEGTRSPDGRLQQGQRTVGKFIYHARPVVVPTVVSGTNRILPKGALLPVFRCPISVRFGPPLDLQHYYDQPDSKHTAAAIVQEVMQAIADLQGAPPASRE